MNTPKPIAALLKDDGAELGRLLAQMGVLERATRLMRAQLGEPLGSHCVAANIKDGALVVQTDSAAWAAKLRFQVGALLQRLNGTAEFAGLRSVRVRVSPAAVPRPPAARARPRISKQAATLLESVAQGTEDEELRAVLLRLSKRRQ